MRSVEEIKKMCEVAHSKQHSEFWRGVKHALFWVIEATEVIEDG